MIYLPVLLALAAQVAPPETVSASPPVVNAPAPPIAVVPVSPVSNPPADLATLDELPLRQRLTDYHDVSGYVRDEVRAGRCTVAGNRIRVDLAVLVAGNGQIRRIRPVAIQCPTVEQYATGIMLRRARSNVPPPGEDRWYRTAVDFAWQ